MPPPRNVYGRVKHLEAEIGQQVVTCPVCTGPIPGENGFIVVDYSGVYKWGRCKRCGLALDAAGKALMPRLLPKTGPSQHVKAYHPDTPLDLV
jgi:hypothetical protein